MVNPSNYKQLQFLDLVSHQEGRLVAGAAGGSLARGPTEVIVVGMPRWSQKRIDSLGGGFRADGEVMDSAK